MLFVAFISLLSPLQKARLARMRGEDVDQPPPSATRVPGGADDLDDAYYEDLKQQGVGGGKSAATDGAAANGDEGGSASEGEDGDGAAYALVSSVPSL